MKIAHIMIVLLALGCSKDKSEPGKGSAKPELSCADAIGKAVSVMPAAPGGEQVVAKLKSLMTTRCEADKWSVAARECYATQVKDMASMKMCRETALTPEQSAAVMSEIRAAMMEAAGSGGGPMHGGGSGSAAAPPAGSGSAK
ncbi:MAG TPA: hypothetical protein VIU61_05995 [Kofleriaceae bacterium]